MPATLEDLRPQAAERREDGEFVDLGWRPIFKEHTNTRDFDGPVRFGREAMERIAANCNRRITQDNDFVPIVLRHTTEDGKNDPEVVGLAGPFKAQKLKSGVWGIYAKWRLYKQDADKSRKYPRVSVELWGNAKDPTDGYFDPVSLLGAETPELDLGVHYQASEDDPTRVLARYHKAFRYQAAPGGANTAAPAMVEEERVVRYEGGGLSQADLKQIIAALRPVIDEAVEAKVALTQPAGADPENLLTSEDDGQIPAEHADMPGETDQMGPTPEELNFGDEAPGDDQDDSDLDAPGGDDDTDIDGESAELDATMIDDEEPKKPAQYSASGRDSETVSFVEDDDMAEHENMELARYKKEAADYRKRHDDLHAKYQKLESDNKSLKSENDSLRTESCRARYAKQLADSAANRVILDEEEELTRLMGMSSDSQRDSHMAVINTHYQRVPGAPGYVGEGKQVAGPARTDADDRRDHQKRARYSKLAAEECQKLQRQKKPYDFKAEFNRLMETDPENIGGAAK